MLKAFNTITIIILYILFSRLKYKFNEIALTVKLRVK